MKNLSRRKFIQTSAVGLAGLSVLPWLKACQTGANDTIRLGFIGLGQQSKFLNNGFNQIPGVKIVAGADVYGIKRQRFEINVKRFQEEKEEKVEVTTYENYQDLLERKDIDAVVIATPDHWHAFQVLDAVKAGKDIYLEKPVTFTIAEGQKIVKAVRDNNLVLAVGSQQRSDENFQHAVNLVRDGKLGELTQINAWVGPTPNPYDLPEEPVPADLDWDAWLGPNPYVHYNSRLNPPISLNPVENETFWAEWRYYKEVGGGFICDWGAHNFDIAQWALDKDNGGPVRIVPAGAEDNEYIFFEYENGLKLLNAPFTEDEGFGVKFWSGDQWVEVSRKHYAASDDSLMPPEPEEKDANVPYETGTPHLVNFIECLRSRKDPIAPVNAGHRSGSLGILANIATELKRPLNWDPVNEVFVNDSEAAKHLNREYREGYSL
ncbi:MAG: Gfo/Idh/MocA family protein [Bacteroidota bacterium]